MCALSLYKLEFTIKAVT